MIEAAVIVIAMLTAFFLGVVAGKDLQRSIDADRCRRDMAWRDLTEAEREEALLADR
jgi:hypothetical protein